jgi:hypothetical protein
MRFNKAIVLNGLVQSALRAAQISVHFSFATKGFAQVARRMGA